ncbi:MAG: putative Zn-dependent protease [Oleiphilaceae bacterium]|jgi:predicted Zn-dependent protease
MLNKIIRGLIVSLFIVLVSACGETDKKQSFVDHMSRAQVYQSQGQYKAAVIEYKNAVKKSQGDVDVILGYAKMLNRLGQFPAALGLLEQVSEDKNKKYYLELVRTYQGMKKFFTAQKLISEHLANESSMVKILKANNVLGMAELQLALKSYEQLVNDPVVKNEALLGKATVLARLNKYTESLAVLELIDSGNSFSIKGDILTAGIQISMQSLEKAETTLSSALSAMRNTDIIEPEKAVVLERLAYVLTRQGRSNEAYIYNKILSEAFPGSNEVKSEFQSAVQKMDGGDLSSAKEILLSILSDYPSYSRATQLLGVISYLQGDMKTASKYLSESVDPEVANDMTRHIYAATNLRLNDPGKVIEILEPGIKQSKNSATLALYGLAAISDKQYEKGEKSLLKAIQLDEKNIRIRLALANYYRNKNRPDLTKEKVQLDAAYAVSPIDKQVLTEMVSYILRNKSASDAEALLKFSIEKYPEVYVNNFLAGSFIAGQERLLEALSYFESALKYTTEDDEILNAMFSIGRLQIALKKISHAEITFEKMINKFPDSVLGYKGLFSTYVLNNNYEGGLKKLEQYGDQLGKLSPYTILIETSIARQDLVSAKSYFEKVKKLNIEAQALKKLHQGIQYVEAIMAMQVNDFAEARSIVAELLSDEPENMRLLSFLVDIETKAGQLNEAEKILSQIKNINPDHPVVNIFKADFAIAKKDISSAVSYLTSAWKQVPSDSVGDKLYKALGIKGDTDGQNKHLKNWLDVMPSSSLAILYQAIAYQQTMQKTKATASYEKVLEKLPNNVMALNNLGWIYHEKNDERSLTLLKKAAELAPENAAVLDSYGWVLAKNGDKKTGLKFLEKANELAPNEAEIKAHLDEVRGM